MSGDRSALNCNKRGIGQQLDHPIFMNLHLIFDFVGIFGENFLLNFFSALKLAPSGNICM